MGQQKRDKDLLDAFSNNLKTILSERKITAYRLAKDLEVSDATVSAFVHGRALPSLTTFNRMLTVLEISDMTKLLR